jgi:hypothetical protein
MMMGRGRRRAQLTRAVTGVLRNTQAFLVLR